MNKDEKSATEIAFSIMSAMSLDIERDTNMLKMSHKERMEWAVEMFNTCGYDYDGFGISWGREFDPQ